MPEFNITEMVKLLQDLTEKSEVVNDCLIWKGLVDQYGYGLKMVKGFKWRVHRLAWTLLKGEILQGLYVCHHCDNPPCWAVTHLFLGTQDDNMRDAVSKGRVHPGETHFRALLSEEDVKRIYTLLNPPGGKTPYGLMKQLAGEYKVSYSTVNFIKRGLSWKHLNLKNGAS